MMNVLVVYTYYDASREQKFDRRISHIANKVPTKEEITAFEKDMESRWYRDVRVINIIPLND